MNTNLVYLMVMTMCTVHAEVAKIHSQEERERRSVQSLVDGIIDAITQKHVRSVKPAKSTSKTNHGETTTVPATTTAIPTTVASLPQLKAPEEPTTPMNVAEITSALAKIDDGENTIADRVSEDINSSVALTETFIAPPPIQGEGGISPKEDYTSHGGRPPVASERFNGRLDGHGGHNRRNYRARTRYAPHWGNPFHYHSQHSPVYPFGTYYNDIDYNNVDIGPSLVPAYAIHHGRRHRPAFIPFPMAPYFPYGPWTVSDFIRPAVAALQQSLVSPPTLTSNYRPLYVPTAPDNPIVYLPSPPVIIHPSSAQSHDEIKTEVLPFDEFVYQDPITSIGGNFNRREGTEYADLVNGQNLTAANQLDSTQSGADNTRSDHVRRAKNNKQKSHSSESSRQPPAEPNQSTDYEELNDQKLPPSLSVPITAPSAPHELPQSHVQYFGQQ